MTTDRFRLKNWLVLALLSMLLIGCSTAGIVGESTPSTGEQKVTVESRTLAQKVEIHSMSSRNAGDLLQVQITVLNKFSSTQDFQYRVSWFDKQGFEIDPEASSWKPVILHGKAKKSLQAVAPTTAAYSYQVVVR